MVQDDKWNGQWWELDHEYCSSYVEIAFCGNQEGLIPLLHPLKGVMVSIPTNCSTPHDGTSFGWWVIYFKGLLSRRHSINVLVVRGTCEVKPVKFLQEDVAHTQILRSACQCGIVWQVNNYCFCKVGTSSVWHRGQERIELGIHFDYMKIWILELQGLHLRIDIWDHGYFSKWNLSYIPKVSKCRNDLEIISLFFIWKTDMCYWQTT